MALAAERAAGLGIGVAEVGGGIRRTGGARPAAGGGTAQAENHDELGMVYLASLFALVAGALIALQFGVNASLRGFIGAGTPFYATLVSYAVGTLGSLACLLAVRPALPVWSRLPAVPWWAWTGGAIGVGYVTASVLLAPKLGATRLIVLIVAGQLLASVAFDHFGLLGYPARPFNLWRATGCVLMVAAVALIKAH